MGIKKPSEWYKAQPAKYKRLQGGKASLKNYKNSLAKFLQVATVIATMIVGDSHCLACIS